MCARHIFGGRVLNKQNKLANNASHNQVAIENATIPLLYTHKASQPNAVRPAKVEYHRMRVLAPLC